MQGEGERWRKQRDSERDPETSAVEGPAGQHTAVRGDEKREGNRIERLPNGLTLLLILPSFTNHHITPQPEQHCKPHPLPHPEHHCKAQLSHTHCHSPHIIPEGEGVSRQVQLLQAGAKVGQPLSAVHVADSLSIEDHRTPLAHWVAPCRPHRIITHMHDTKFKIVLIRWAYLPQIRARLAHAL